MPLGEFIRANLEPILVEWENFARTILPAAQLDAAALRDHAREILLATVRDMATDQTGQEQSDKSTGHGVDSSHSRELDSASGDHAIGRVEAGFDVMQLVSEYRALRASVVRLWQNSHPTPDRQDLTEVTRFNESMDQSLAKAVQSYTRRVEDTRNTFLAILSHDLRSPLAAILLSAKMVGTLAGDDTVQALAGSMSRSATAMSEMIEDLLKFAATSLGTRIEVVRDEIDLLPLCREVVVETRAGHPDCTIDLHAEGTILCSCDGRRLREVLTNLLSNAVKHGGAVCHVAVSLGADPDRVHLSVHNGGEPIPPDLLPNIFQPMVRARRESSQKVAGGLGLGLAIVDRIVSAHGGQVDVTSTAEAGTTFTVHLPRGLT